MHDDDYEGEPLQGYIAEIEIGREDIKSIWCWWGLLWSEYKILVPIARFLHYPRKWFSGWEFCQKCGINTAHKR